ncbi:MAG TPA: hypothetical protein GX717_00220, partial [Clostridiaceae bacterium]|nr:hypothetical protein [Clostridiaceae bacterium]
MNFIQSIKDQVLDYQFLNRPVWTWIQFGVIVILLLIAFRLLGYLIKLGMRQKFTQTKEEIDQLKRPISIIVTLFFFSAIFSIAIDQLELTGNKEVFISRLGNSFIILAIALAFYYVVPTIVHLSVHQSKKSKIKVRNRTLANFLYLLVKFLVVIFAVFA